MDLPRLGQPVKFVIWRVFVTCGVARLFSATSPGHPVGILTNLPQVKSKLRLQWPCLFTCGDELLYNGPLPVSCPCVPQHRPFKGTDELADFVSSSSQSLGKSFWKLCLAGVVDGSQLSLRDGDILMDAALP